MAPIRRLVLDVLKPSEVQTVSFARTVAGLDGVEAVAAHLVETDRDVQNIALVLEGSDIDVDAVFEHVEDLGGTLHSVDEVACGSFIPSGHEARANATWLR